MARSFSKTNTRTKVCPSALDNVMTLQNRAIVAPLDFGQGESTEEFNDIAVVDCKVVTRTGVTVFDSTNVEQIVTHQFFCRFISGVTAETWIIFEGIRYNILYVDDMDEQHEWLRLDCSVRGSSGLQVNDA